MRTLRLCVALAAATLLALTGIVPPASAENSGPLTPVRLALQWKPQSQFAGYYMARDQGFYRAAGVDITLLHADARQGSLQMIENGRAEAATSFLSDGILGAGRLAQIAQFGQRSNLMLIAWKEMGINSAADLHGQRISFWQGSFSAAYQAFFAEQQVEPVAIPQYFSVNLFLNRGVAACAAMEYNEYHALWQAGIDAEQVTTFLMRDYGLGFPEDGLYASPAWVGAHPAAARALRQATLAGWEYARAHPEEAIATVLKEARLAGIPANRSHERWMLSHILDSIFIPGGTPGALKRTDFMRTAAALRAAGQLAEIPPFESFAPLEGEQP